MTTMFVDPNSSAVRSGGSSFDRGERITFEPVRAQQRQRQRLLAAPSNDTPHVTKNSSDSPTRVDEIQFSVGGPSSAFSKKVSFSDLPKHTSRLKLDPETADQDTVDTERSISSDDAVNSQDKRLDDLSHIADMESTRGGLHDLFPFFKTNQWEELRDVIEKLRQIASPEDLRTVFSATNQSKETPLHVAAWKAPPRLTMSMLELLPVADRKDFLLESDGDGNNPLMLACANLDEKMEFRVVKQILLLAPEALEMSNFHGDTALHMLCASDAFTKSPDFTVEAAAEEAILSLLHMVGPHSVARQNYDGLTLLHIAIGNHAHERVLVQLLNTWPEVARIPDNRGMLPVHYVASSAGSRGGTPWTFVRQLIDAYPECITTQTQDGDTPLHLLMANAALYVEKDQLVDRNTTKLAELLIGSVGSTASSSEASSSAAVRNESDDDSDKHHRLEHPPPENATIDRQSSPLLIQNVEDLSPLHACAIYKTPPQLTRRLMEAPLADAASTLTTRFGATALHLACASERFSSQLLNVEALATPRACAVVDTSDRTPLAIAVQHGKKASSSIVKAVCRAFPQACSMTTKAGYLPIHLAVQSRKSKTSVVKALIRADPKTLSVPTRKTGNTPLHEACQYRAPFEVIKMIIDKYPPALHMRNKDGDLPSAVAKANKADKQVLRHMEMKSTVKFRPEDVRKESVNSMAVHCGW